MRRYSDADEMKAINCRNEKKSMCAMPVVMAKMGGNFAGREMPPRFQIPFTSQMFARQYSGQQYLTAGVYDAQTI